MLVKDIEQKRQQLVEVIKKHGLTSINTLKCSQELDRLIEVYQQEQYSSKRKHKQTNISLSKL